MPKDKRAAGKAGEELAAAYFIREGYSVVHRNYTVRGGELDLVAEKDGVLVIAEVKTRGSLRYGTGGEAVNPRKIQRLVSAAQRFLYEYRDAPYVQNHTVRFDVIEIDTQSGNLRHIKEIDIN